MVDHKQISFVPAEIIPPVDRADPGFTLRRTTIGADPVRTLIVLDHELIGDIAIGAARAMAAEGRLAGTRILSIGFDRPDLAKLSIARAASFTFERGRLDVAGWTDTGHAPKLIDFLSRTVLPMCVSDRERPSLLGYSLSGAFALQAPGHLQGAFDAVCAISPSIWAEPAAHAAIVAAAQADPKLRVYLRAGGLERDADLTGLPKHLFELVQDTDQALQGVAPGRVFTAIHEEETHFSIPFAAMCGLLTALARSG